MPRSGANRLCICDAPVDANGRCTAIPSCSDFKRPAMRQRSLDSKLKRREIGARHGFPGRREVADGAAKAMARSPRSVRGVGGDASNAVLEDELATGRW